MTRHGQGERVTISLPLEHIAALRRVAIDRFNGNLSAIVRELIENSPVTKSALSLSGVAK